MLSGCRKSRDYQIRNCLKCTHEIIEMMGIMSNGPYEICLVEFWRELPFWFHVHAHTGTLLMTLIRTLAYNAWPLDHQLCHQPANFCFHEDFMSSWKGITPANHILGAIIIECQQEIQFEFFSHWNIGNLSQKKNSQEKKWWEKKFLFITPVVIIYLQTNRNKDKKIAEKTK